MRALVIGGCGYIGSHLVKLLEIEQHEVVVLDDLSTGRRGVLSDKVQFYWERDTNLRKLKKIMKHHQIEVVFHLAAKLSVEESVRAPLTYFEHNGLGVLNVLKAMEAVGVRQIVFSSTAAVYGDLKRAKAHEDDVCVPINPYGASKLAGEWMIKAAAKAHHFNYVILRYFNVVGATSDFNLGENKAHRPTHLVPLVLASLSTPSQPLQVFGNDYKTPDHTCVRDYIDVHDLARAHLKAAAYALSGKSNTFNIGSGKGFSVLEIIKATEAVTGQTVNYTFASRRPGDPAVLVADVARAKTELDFQAEVSLAEMIASEAAWRALVLKSK